MDLVLTWNTAIGGYDLAQSGSDLLLDDTLQTLVILSLFTERRAVPSDPGADPADLGGWWGNEALSTARPGTEPDEIGSRLHLLRRALATPKTAALGVAYTREALQHMIRDNICQRIDVSAAWKDIYTLVFTITIIRQINGRPTSTVFDLPWSHALTVQ